MCTHDVGYWAHSFLQNLERTSKDHIRRRCWSISFGLGFRVISPDPNFRNLSVEVERIVSDYKRTKNRAILLDYDGKMMPQTSISKTPNSEANSILNSLCRDPMSAVFLASATDKEALNEWFSLCENLGIAADSEHGYLLRLKDDAEWKTCVSVSDFDWKQVAEPVMKLYTETTDDSSIEAKESALVWHCRYADPNFGACQAKELPDNLESVLANEPVSVKSCQHIVEVKPHGVTKGLVAERLLSLMKQNGKLPDFVLCVGDDRSDKDTFEGVTKGLVAERLLSLMKQNCKLPDFVLCVGDDRSDKDMFEVITSAMAGPSLSSIAEVFLPARLVKNQSKQSIIT